MSDTMLTEESAIEGRKTRVKKIIIARRQLFFSFLKNVPLAKAFDQ